VYGTSFPHLFGLFGVQAWLLLCTTYLYGLVDDAVNDFFSDPKKYDCSDCVAQSEKASKVIEIPIDLLPQYNELYAKNVEKARAAGAVFDDDLWIKIHHETLAEVQKKARVKGGVAFACVWFIGFVVVSIILSGFVGGS
jgi:hypothetical protein